MKQAKLKYHVSIMFGNVVVHLEKETSVTIVSEEYSKIIDVKVQLNEFITFEVGIRADNLIIEE